MKKNTKITIIFIICSLVFITPLIFTILSSFKTNNEIFSTPFALPTIYHFKNYVEAWKNAKIGKYFFNSVIISLSTVVLTALLSSMISFTLALFHFKFKKIIYGILIIGLMVPMQSILVPISYSIGVFGMKNNLFAMILVYVAFSISFSTLIVTGFIKGIEKSLIEAAIVDGASYHHIFFKIVCPLIMPAISTISIFNFLGAWNNIIFPLLFINNENLNPISIGLLNFSGEHGSNYGPLMAAIAITVLIPFLVYVLFQEKVESGLSAGATKG